MFCSLLCTTYIKRGQAIPAEDVFASLAHHLGTAGISLYRNCAHRTSLDVLRLCPRHPHGHVTRHVRALSDQGRPILRTGEARVPRGGTQGTELLDTRGARDRNSLRFISGTNMTNCITARLWTPGTIRVQGYFCKQRIHHDDDII